MKSNTSTDTSKVNAKVKDIVDEYSDLFPVDLPELPPERNHAHEIHLEPGSKAFAKKPYRMSLKEL